MNRQRKVVITVTYNELRVIVDTKAEELDSSAQPNLQPTCNQLATDTISRQGAIGALSHMCSEDKNGRTVSRENVNCMLRALPSAQPKTCEGCKHLGKWENEVEYGYNSPCTGCKRRADDHYER